MKKLNGINCICRKWILVTVCSMSFLVTACGGSDAKVIDGTVNKTVSKSAESGTVGEAKEQTEVQTQDAESAISYKGYVFSYKDVVMEMDADAAPVIEKLGEPVSYFEAPSCAFEGIDKMYTYNSFEVDTYPTKDKDFISTVIFKDDTVATMEGIGIGDSLLKIKETYGEDFTEESGMMVYIKDGMKLCFVVQDDSVAAVEYRSTVLDE